MKIKIEALKLNELKHQLELRKLDKKGNKAVLIYRLQNATNSEYITIEEGLNSSDSDTEDDETVFKTVSENDTNMHVKNKTKRRYYFNNSDSLQLCNFKAIRNLSKTVCKLKLLIKQLCIENKKLVKQVNNNNIQSDIKISTLCNKPGEELSPQDNSTLNIKARKPQYVNKDSKKEVNKEIVNNNTGKNATINRPLIKERTINSTKYNSNSNIGNMKIRKEKPVKLLLLSDSYGRSCVNILNNSIDPTKMETLTIFKPNGNFADVTEDLKNTTRYYGKKDYVIIWAGMNDALRKSQISNEKLQEITALQDQTNVIIVTLPYCKDQPILNKFIYNINKQIHDAIISKQSGISYIDVNSLFSSSPVRSGVHLSNNKKRVIINYVMNIIINEQFLPSVITENSFVNTNNLISITPTSSVVNQCNKNKTPKTLRNKETRLYPVLPEEDDDLNQQDFTQTRRWRF